MKTVDSPALLEVETRITKVLADVNSSDWIKHILRQAINMNCRDAMHDLQLLSDLITARTNALIGRKTS
jgi:hypothetical protein